MPPGRPTERAHLRFDRVTQPWLRELTKRWLRLRLSSGLSPAIAKAGLDALACFSQLLATAGITRLAQVDRPLLERHLAWVNTGPDGLGVKKTRIGQLNIFLHDIRRNGWDDTLPGTATFFPGDTAPVPEKLNRRLAEYVMAQVEAPENLGRWPDPAGRLITLILIRCGLRISSVLGLEFDCLLHDGQNAPYLRYLNTKMKREAAVPLTNSSRPRSSPSSTASCSGGPRGLHTCSRVRTPTPSGRSQSSPSASAGPSTAGWTAARSTTSMAVR